MLNLAFERGDLLLLLLQLRLLGVEQLHVGQILEVALKHGLLVCQPGEVLAVLVDQVQSLVQQIDLVPQVL